MEKRNVGYGNESYIVDFGWLEFVFGLIFFAIFGQFFLLVFLENVS